MKSTLIILNTALLLTVCVISEVLGQAWLKPNAINPKYPNRCYYAGPPEVILKLGQKKRIDGTCTVMSCLRGYSLESIGCGLPVALPHCRIVQGDLSKPHPLCCDEVIC